MADLSGGAVSTVSGVSRKAPSALKRMVGPLILLAPMNAFVGTLLVASAMILRLSFTVDGGQQWSLRNYSALGEAYYVGSMLVTLKLAFLSAVMAVLLGFPIAMFLTRIRVRTVRRLVLFVLLLPLLMSHLLQSYGWMVILAPGGLLNQVIERLGFGGMPLLIFSQSGVLIGLVQVSLPLAVLPMSSAMRNIPKSVEEAGRTLGANRFQVLRHVVFPLTLPGVLAATLLIFAWNMSAFVVPLVLGGGRVSMLTLIIRDQMGPILNWPFGSAISIALVGITLTILLIYQRLTSGYVRLWQ